MTRVLIVDDKEENLYYLRTVLTGYGYAVESAMHGAEALFKARQAPPDLVVSDLLMPVMDGYTLLRHWKMDERLRKIPFIVYTATYTEEEDEQLAMSLGADAFILKPAEPDDFLSRIQEVQANAAASIPTLPKHAVADEKALLKVYSETLIRKLEEKTLQLEEANRTLQNDIAERRVMETALRESEARLATATAAGRIGIWDWDILTGKAVCSRMHEELWGLPPGGFGGTFDEFRRGVHPDDWPAVEAAIQQAIETQSEYQHEHRVVWRDGSIHWISGHGKASYNAEGKAVRMSGVVQDITERKKLEQQFLRAQRMEGIGTLAGGIAHDLNNVLGPIILSIDLLKMKFPDQDSQDLISIIATSAQRGASMVNQVLSFARGVAGKRVELEVKHVIRDMEKIANETFLKSIRIHTSLPDDLWPVVGDPTQVHQVLLNLCVNARDAMPNGGRLTLTAENVAIDAHYAGLTGEAKPGPYVLLQVEDDGAGIAPEVLEKIFDPFFTTKEIGKGTGLGLSTTMAIVKSHGGFIQVSSELGSGTKFKVYLPALEGAPREESGATEVKLPRGDGELILVVDDEFSVRQITKQTLEAFGYRVVLAVDGTEAVAAFAQQGKEIAAVVTDMMMPVMDGPATIQVLRRMDPRLPIIAASGLTSNGQAAEVAGLGVQHFLPKPYTAEALLTTLRQMLANQEIMNA